MVQVGDTVRLHGDHLRIQLGGDEIHVYFAPADYLLLLVDYFATPMTMTDRSLGHFAFPPHLCRLTQLEFEILTGLFIQGATIENRT